MTVTDADCMIGEENAAWVPLSLDGGDPNDAFHVIEEVRNNGSTDYYLQYTLALPTHRGTRTLKLDRVNVMLNDADDDNYLNMIKVLGRTNSGLITYLYSSAVKNRQEDIDLDINPDKDATGAKEVIVTLHIVGDSANNVRISGVLLKVFYS